MNDTPTHPADFDLSEDPQGRLTLRRSGQDDVADVRVRRAFPWSSPQQFVSIRTTEGKELMLLDDLSTLSPAERQSIDRALGQSSFIPRITRVEQVGLHFGHQQWTVHTDRGPADFRVQEREDIRYLGDGRHTIKDADGNVYELPDVSTLDEHSRKAVEPIL